MALSLAQINTMSEHYQILSNAYHDNNVQKFYEVLEQIYPMLLNCSSFLMPSRCASETIKEELILARGVLELAFLFACAQKNLTEMSKYFIQLSPYLNNLCKSDSMPIPESPRSLMIIGLHLVGTLLTPSGAILMQQELEKIPKQLHTSLYIKFPHQLERFLMEGSYFKLLNLRTRVPAPEFLPLVELLESKVRTQIIQSIPYTYDMLTVASAQHILMLNTVEETEQIAAEFNWEYDTTSNIFNFKPLKENMLKRINSCLMDNSLLKPKDHSFASINAKIATTALTKASLSFRPSFENLNQQVSYDTLPDISDASISYLPLIQNNNVIDSMHVKQILCNSFHHAISLNKVV